MFSITIVMYECISFVIYWTSASIMYNMYSIAPIHRPDINLVRFISINYVLAYFFSAIVIFFMPYMKVIYITILGAKLITNDPNHQGVSTSKWIRLWLCPVYLPSGEDSDKKDKYCLPCHYFLPKTKTPIFKQPIMKTNNPLPTCQ